VSVRPRSWVPAALTLVLVLLQLLAPHRVWVILLCGVGGMTGLALIWARALARSVRVSRSLQHAWAQVGDELRESFVFRNEGRWPVIWAEIDDRSDLPGYPASQVVAAEGGTTFRWRATATCRQRGLFTLGPWAVHMQDPFGFFSVCHHYEETHRLLVVPRLVEPPPLALPRGAASGRMWMRKQALDLTLNVSAVRPYESGDPLRRIHWPSSARQGALMSKLFDAEATTDLWIVLDLERSVQAGEGATSTEEVGVTLAASLAAKMLRRGRAVGLLASGAREATVVPGRGQGQLWRLLEALALVRSGDGPALAATMTRMQGGLGRRAALALITPSGDRGWVEALWPLLRRGLRPAALLLDPSAFGGEGGISAVRRALAGLGVPVHVVSDAAAAAPPGEGGPQGQRVVR